MKKKTIIKIIILALIVIITVFVSTKQFGIPFSKTQNACLLDRPEFWENVIEISFYDFDENIYITSDNEKLEMIQKILIEMDYVEIENPWIEGWYLFEIRTNETVHSLGISSDIMSFDGKFYKATDSVEGIGELMRNTIE